MDVRIGTVTGRTVGTNNEGTEPGRLLQVVVTDFSDTHTVEMGQPGEEYNPPNGTRVVIGQAGSAYKMVLSADDGVAPVMGVGGRRTYSTDETGETVKAELRLHPDGRVDLFNIEVAFTMLPDGSATLSNTVMGEISLGPDGACALTNDNGSVTLAQTGAVTVTNDAGSISLAADGGISAENANASVSVSPAGVITFNGVSAEHNHFVQVTHLRLVDEATSAVYRLFISEGHLYHDTV